MSKISYFKWFEQQNIQFHCYFYTFCANWSICRSCARPPSPVSLPLWLSTHLFLKNKAVLSVFRRWQQLASWTPLRLFGRRSHLWLTHNWIVAILLFSRVSSSLCLSWSGLRLSVLVTCSCFYWQYSSALKRIPSITWETGKTSTSKHLHLWAISSLYWLHS